MPCDFRADIGDGPQRWVLRQTTPAQLRTQFKRGCNALYNSDLSKAGCGVLGQRAAGLVPTFEVGTTFDPPFCT